MILKDKEDLCGEVLHIRRVFQNTINPKMMKLPVSKDCNGVRSAKK